MANIKDYTVLEIIKRYEKIIGTNAENILFESISEGYRKYIKTLSDKSIKTLGVEQNNKIVRLEMIYSIIKRMPEINNDDDCKLRVVSNIYREFSKTMNSKEVAETKKMILGDKKYAVLKFDISDNNNVICDYEFITRENKRKLSSIRNDRTRSLIEHSFEIADTGDLESIVDSKYSRGLFAAIMSKLTNEFFLKQKGFSVQELRKMIENEKNYEIIEKYEDEFVHFALDYLKNNLQYIDITDLLLNSAARVMLGIKIKKEEQIKGIKLSENNSGELETSIEYLRQIYIELKRGTYEDRSYAIFLEDGSEAIRVNKEIIEQFLERCTENDYITDREVRDIHKQILDGKLVSDAKKRKIANVNLQDLKNLSSAYQETEDEKVRENMLRCSKELIEYLKSENKIEDDELLDLYINGEINLDIIKNVAISENSEEYYNNKFKRLYDAMIYGLNPEEDVRETELKEAKDLIRFSKFYRYLLEEDVVDIDNLIEKLITAYGEEVGSETMDTLYDLKLVSLEKCVDWVGTEILVKQYEKGKLPPANVRELYQRGIIDLDIISNVVGISPDNAQKFMIIGSIFPGESEEDKRNRKYLTGKCIEIDSEGLKSENGEKREKNDSEHERYKKHITDPFDRMNLIGMLDKEYYFEMTLDGHIIAHLPTFQEVIIEKILDKNSEPSYGSATYILSEEYLNKNKSEIIIDDKVNRQKMIKDIELKGVTKIVHHVNRWGEDIKEHFGIEEKSKWNEEDLTNIETAIERIKRNQSIRGEN